MSLTRWFWAFFGSNLSNFESENSIGWKRSSNFISLYLAFWRCNNNTKLRSFLAYFTRRQKQFFQKTLKISAPNSFFTKKKPKFFYLILDFFNKFHELEMTIWRNKREDWSRRSNLKTEVEDRILKIELEDRIWRLKLKIEFEDWYRRWRNSWTSWCSTK